MKKIIFGLLFGFLVLSNCFAESNAGVFFGVFREGAPANMGLIKSLEKKLGKKFTVVMWYQDYSSQFNPDLCNRVIANGAIPHIVWEPWLWSDKQKIKLDNIIAGEWDSHIREWAQDIKAWGKPVFIRWGHEFNIEGYPWCIVNNGKDPKKYVSAFRRVKTIFKNEGANNAYFVWAPMNDSWPKESWNDMHLAYPGDEYVDWIGIDGYNWGTTQDWSSWQSFKELFRDTARQMWRKYPNKPIMIAEVGCSEKGGNKAQWILDMLQDLKRMPYIRQLSWFDVKKEADWRIETNEKTLSAFKTVINNPYVISNSQILSNTISLPATKAITKQTVLARFAANPPKIDGSLSDWTTSNPIVIDQESQLQEGYSLWRGPSDLSGKIYIQWDSSNLYIAADVKDNHPFKNTKTTSNIWNGDAIEITIGLNPNAQPSREKFAKGDRQIGFSTGDGKSVKPSIWDWTNAEEPKNSKIVVSRKPDGYILEAKIPWDSLMAGFVPSSGMKISFDCAIDDSDDGKSRTKQMVWNGDYMFYKDPGVWGILKFVN